MSINFSKSVKERLLREIFTLEEEFKSLLKKQQQAEGALKILQRDSKKSATPSDLNNKLARINKLNKELADYPKQQSELTRQLASKKSILAKYQQ